MMLDPTQSPCAAPPSLFVQRPAQPEQARALRHAVSRYVQELGWPDEQIEAVTLAVGEAINNAVSYGQEAAGAEVSLSCRLSPPDALTIEIRNPGGDFHPDLSSVSALPDDLAVHGRGFALMSLLMDTVQVFTENQETVVRLIKHLAS